MAVFFNKTRNNNFSDNPNDNAVTLGEHLEELRDRIFKILAALGLGWAIGWFLQPEVYTLLSSSAKSFIPSNIEYKETFHSITDPFMLKLRVSFYIGAVIVFPAVVWQVWGFIAPGMKKSEKKPLFILAPVSTLLFSMGVFCCWTVLPTAFKWFVSYAQEFPETAVYQVPGTLIFFILKMMLAFGVGFQLPILVFGAAKMGIVKTEDLLYYWRHAIFGIFVMSMCFVPTADPMSLFMLAVPLCLLYFLSVLAVKITTKKSKRPSELDDLD